METFTAENFTGVRKEDLRTNRPLKYLVAKSVIGNKVHNDKEEHLGEIEDIIIDSITGKIYFIIQLQGFAITNEKYFAIPFSFLDVDADKKQFILYQSKEILEKAPGFDMNHW
ncbi:MAG: PRC-barrel domain-containing protein, partial [Bacteroidota bacterium]|nr:PRC-barrel domain-containing protein [Bacteroidota bacterium]